ncbi:MAG: Asp23/Gls24 family envelope stress response protein [Thermovenabulum sp.]|uniref:Asp23/Gls24 family envelope stress response protein n=1 Tax=Thermovenabulum sp. TaxID=3100335 RepID=UPI003C7D586A
MVIALIGKSGTGKSHKALMIAALNNAEIIIDDGLLIYNNSVVAGISAKKEKTKIAAIKRALFKDPSHAKEVREKLSEIGYDKNILIIGTSVNMVKEICNTLSLSLPDKIVYIEEISSDKEIEIAKYYRSKEGKHAIPAPTLEVKKYFSGYLLDPMKIFFRRGKIEFEKESTVVRPTYSYLGRYTISNVALEQLALFAANSVKGVAKGGRAILENYESGIVINLELNVEYGFKIDELLSKVQEEVKKIVEYHTALNVLRVNVTAKKLIL